MGKFTVLIQCESSVGRIFLLNMICGILFFHADGLAVLRLDALLAAIGLVIVDGAVGCSS